MTEKITKWELTKEFPTRKIGDILVSLDGKLVWESDKKELPSEFFDERFFIPSLNPVLTVGDLVLVASGQANEIQQPHRVCAYEISEASASSLRASKKERRVIYYVEAMKTETSKTENSKNPVFTKTLRGVGSRIKVDEKFLFRFETYWFITSSGSIAKSVRIADVDIDRFAALDSQYPKQEKKANQKVRLKRYQDTEERIAKTVHTLCDFQNAWIFRSKMDNVYFDKNSAETHLSFILSK